MLSPPLPAPCYFYFFVALRPLTSKSGVYYASFLLLSANLILQFWFRISQGILRSISLETGCFRNLNFAKIVSSIPSVFRKFILLCRSDSVFFLSSVHLVFSRLLASVSFIMIKQVFPMVWYLVSGL